VINITIKKSSNHSDEWQRQNPFIEDPPRSRTLLQAADKSSRASLHAVNSGPRREDFFNDSVIEAKTV
tara:strand:- start:320 stop:523 length:204 start_codon:yes stop_codon:yes gene_type:complete